jgi:hypothetical protein
MFHQMFFGDEMSLDVYLNAVRTTCVFEKNITHNLGTMAEEAGLYDYLWEPENVGIVYAAQLIEPLSTGLELLKSDPGRFREFDPPNGWGDYDGLINFVDSYLKACIENPDATIEISR